MRGLKGLEEFLLAIEYQEPTVYYYLTKKKARKPPEGRRVASCLPLVCIHSFMANNTIAMRVSSVMFADVMRCAWLGL